MSGKIPRAGLLGMLAVAVVGCNAPPATQAPLVTNQTSLPADAIPTIPMPDQISPSEMVTGEDTELETQQRWRGRGRRPAIRWRRTFYGGSPYYVPYYYYYWAPQPYYVPYYSGVYWNYYDRPGFRYRSRRFRRGY